MRVDGKKDQKTKSIQTEETFSCDFQCRRAQTVSTGHDWSQETQTLTLHQTSLKRTEGNQTSTKSRTQSSSQIRTAKSQRSSVKTSTKSRRQLP